MENEIVYIGDQHGNPVKMLKHLEQLGFIDNNSQIESLIEAAYRNNEVVEFGKLLNQLEFNQDKINSYAVIWLGDLIAERGRNDAMTYRLFGLMHKNGINFKIIISNHDAVALLNLIKIKGRWLPKKETEVLSRADNQSCIYFAEYIESASPAEKKQVSDDIDVYLKHLTLCSLEDDFKDPTRKTLAMHARPTFFILNMMLVMVLELEIAGKIKPGVHDFYNFHDVVNILNSYFKECLSTLKLFNDKRFKNYCNNLLFNNDKLYSLAEEELFKKLLAHMVWNRLDSQWFTEENKNSFRACRLVYPEIKGKLTFVHGHDGGKYTLKEHSCGTKEFGLDNRVGFSVNSIIDSQALALERKCIQVLRPFTGDLLTTDEISGGEEAKESVERKLINFLFRLEGLSRNNELIKEIFAMINRLSFHRECLNQPIFRKCLAAGYHYLNVNDKIWNKEQGCMDTRNFLENLCEKDISSSDYEQVIRAEVHRWLAGYDRHAPTGKGRTSRLTIAFKYGIIPEKPKQYPSFWQRLWQVNKRREALTIYAIPVRFVTAQPGQ